MAESAVSFLLKKLSVWLQQHQQQLQGLEHEAEYIQREMGHMKAFLHVADAKEESDLQLKEWVMQVRAIAYDTEDVLERYLLKFASRGSSNGYSGRIKQIYMSIKFMNARRQFAQEFKTIKSRVQNVSQSHEIYRKIYPIIDQSSSSALSTNIRYDGRGDALLLEEADVMGIEEPKKQLLEWIRSLYGIKVISVVGMGGLGKTTLVKKVYDDKLVKVKFNHHIWITVSESFKVEHLLGSMIKRLLDEVKQPPPQNFEVMNANEMREFIYNFLQYRNYIIVLDDIWKIDAWEAIRYAFPRSGTNKHGCIIITTRFNSIGTAACTEINGCIYSLQPLTEKVSEQLFYRKAFLGNSCPPNLKLRDISKSILQRCRGLPLAIVVIGGLLATKKNRIEEWEMFNRSLGDELEGDDLKKLKELISLSYYDLPYYLKSCFLYLSILPNDESLEKWRLIRLWIAEGFVQEKQGKTTEEVAEGYLNELLNRSLIQIGITSSDGRPSQFHIHDLLKEYIISQSRVQNIAVTNSGGNMNWPDKVRRIALDTSFNIVQESHTFKYLRSFLWSGSEYPEFEMILRKVLGGGSRLLKVLDLRGAPIDAIPKAVFKLYHLKYLSLRNTKVKLIPKRIRYLQNLEILDLKGSMVTELPIEIVNLQKLRHLLLYSYKVAYPIPFINIQSFKAPYEIMRLTSLQKLAYIDANGVDGMNIVRELKNLTQLRRLGIAKLRKEDGKDLCSSLAKLTNLRSLCIYSIGAGEIIDLEQLSLFPTSTLAFLRTLALRGRLEKVPQWISSLDSLTRLFLSCSGLKEDPLKFLEGLPNLAVLGMYCAYDGEGLSFKAGGFQSLKLLRLDTLESLKWVRVEKGSMPNLEKLKIGDCKLVVDVPKGIENLANLQYVEFTAATEEFAAKLSDQKEKGGDGWKLGHVTTVGVFHLVNGEVMGKWLQKSN